MIRPKARPIMIRPSVIHRFEIRPTMIRAFLALALAAGLLGLLHAQSGQTISILMLDGKTGKPLVPDNYIVRFNHLDAIHNEALQLNEDGWGRVGVPATPPVISAKGNFHVVKFPVDGNN